MNEIFDPEQPAHVFGRKSPFRELSITADKSTNYGVVRLELLEHIYNDLYMQTLNTNTPNHRILRYRTIESAKVGGAGTIQLHCHNSTADFEGSNDPTAEVLEFDAVIVATGYVRDYHTRLLQPLEHLNSKDELWAVDGDYRVKLDPAKVSSKAGIWLQGCNEKTHGVSRSSPETEIPLTRTTSS